MEESQIQESKFNASAQQPSDDPAATNASAATEKDSQIESLQNQLSEFDTKYKYLYAEFDNYKKRTFKERTDLLKFGWEPVAHDLVAVIDNLERALAHTHVDTDKNLVSGLEMTLKQFHDVLERNGVKTLAVAGQVFDPNLHESVAQSPSAEIEEGKVIREEMKGYLMHGRLLRPAKVVVSTGKPV